jgi:dUTP pyrophosphatase
MLKLKMKKLINDAILFNKTFESDAGYDLYAAEDMKLKKGKVKKIKTNIAIEIENSTEIPVFEDKKYFGLICDRSSIGSLGIKTLGGVIDKNYRGSIDVLLIKLTKKKHIIKKGDKIAQIIFLPLLDIKETIEADELSTTDRNENGFGSTGK